MPNSIQNEALLIEYKKLWHVVTSSAEAETVGIFHNVQVAIHLQHMLQQLSHPQPKTKLKTDDATANFTVHNNITQKNLNPVI